jgi:primary-amine oxidase
MKSLTRLLGAFALIAAGQPAVARSQSQVCSVPHFVEVSFPTAGPEETRWKLCWQVLDGPNLVITGAWFRPAPTASWIKLIYDARVSQLFVPYHTGSPRYLDIGYGFGAVSLTSSDCLPPTGVIVGANSEVCKELRDRGLAWKHDEYMRRGEELVLWSVMAAANYNYVIEWSFRDDGIVEGRVGATGQIAGTDAHMHGPIWRLDLDLNGACCDAVSIFKHSEPGVSATDTYIDVVTESARSWNAESFTMLQIRDQTLKSSSGKYSEWQLMPSVSGTPVHDEDFTKKPFWVTQYKWSEMFGDELPTYASPAEVVLDRDVVLWYHGGLHHLIRDEDTDMTHLMWVGFMLKPYNVWSKTPLYP